MKTKVIKIDLDELKSLLHSVYLKAVNSYHDLQDIIVNEVVDSFLGSFDEESKIEINIGKNAEQQTNYVSLGIDENNNLIENQNVTIAFPTPTNYNSLEHISIQTTIC